MAKNKGGDRAKNVIAAAQAKDPERIAKQHQLRAEALRIKEAQVARENGDDWRIHRRG